MRLSLNRNIFQLTIRGVKQLQVFQEVKSACDFAEREVQYYLIYRETIGNR